MLRRRASGVLVTAVALVAALGGCARVAGDGELVDDWKPVADATWTVPAAGSCVNAVSSHVDRVPDRADPAGCDKRHVGEVVHAGQMTGPATVMTEPPRAGAQAYQGLYGDCERVAREYLGDDWWNGRLHLRLLVPHSHEWAGGARFYWCELMEVRSPAGVLEPRNSSLRDGLRGSRPLASGCYTLDRPDDIPKTSLTPVDCAQPHHAEFAGTFRGSFAAGLPAGEARTDAGLDGCLPVVRQFVGVTGALQLDYLYWGFNQTAWQAGDWRVRCYALTPDPAKRLRGTVKGLGNAPPPLI